MVIGVVGLGSMGKRRIRLLKKINDSFTVIGIDSREDRREEAAELFGITVAEDLQRAIEKYAIEAVVVSTSPVSHAGIINTILKNGCHVFTELNLVDDLYDENMSLAEEKGVELFLSSTMMYRKEVQYIKEEVAKSTLPVNYSYHVGQFLPTWHPWESYKSFFVGNKRTNGCREVFAIELPWITDTFGEIESFVVKKGRMTDLDIDYPDNYEVILSHASGNTGTLNVNVSSLHAVRNMEIYGQECYMRWGGTPETLAVYDEESKSLQDVILYDNAESINDQNKSIIEDAYEQELQSFLLAIEKKAKPCYSFKKDKSILKLIDQIEGEE